MPELRKDPVLDRWVIISTERSQRPTDLPVAEEPPHKKECPFCAGHENETPPELFSFRSPQSASNTPGWDVRVVPNKYPALKYEGEIEKLGEGMYDKMNGFGVHEVIIETPDHKLNLEDQPVGGIAKVLETYKLRLEALIQDDRLRSVLIFKNVGREAGASLEHPHSQLIATPVLPKRIKERLKGAQNYYNEKERCVFCDILSEEKKIKERLVYENESFVAFCPYASNFPFEIWVLPKKHHPDFQETSLPEMSHLADCLKIALRKLTKVLHKPQYNYVLNTGPVRKARKGQRRTTLDKDFHWHIEIMPRMTRIAGFESGSDLYINPMMPEAAAQYLRDVKI